MRGQSINLRHLRAFAEVCRQGGVSAAAEIVHLSQPAITQAIAKLETTLDTQLFMRSSRGMSPTEAGCALLHRVERALRILQLGTRAGRRRDAGSLALSLTST